MIPNSFYQAELAKAELSVKAAQLKVRKLSIVRLLVFVFLAYTVFLSLDTQLWLFLSVALIILFLAVIKLYVKADELLQYATNQVRVCKDELNCQETGMYNKNTGSSYLHTDHPYTADLDIFGDRSLFSYINRTETVMGENALVEALLNPPMEVNEIRERQVNTQELASFPDFLLSYKTRARIAGSHKQTYSLLLHWLQDKPVFLTKKIIPILLWLIPALAALGFFLAYQYAAYGLLIGVILFNWFFAGLYLKQVNQIHHWVGKQKSVLASLAQLNQLVAAQPFQSKRLIQLQQQHQDFLANLKQLSTLASTFDQRLNTMLGPIFNSLLLFDMQCVWRIEKWKQQHSEHMLNWLQAFGEMELLVTQGSFVFNHQHYVFPEVSEQKLTFQAIHLKHPVMREEAVGNSFTYHQNNKVFIITGSNMSGKSTFLRTIGTSILTGMMGLPVNATSLMFSPVRLMSSMRITDSLQDHTSYFYAELKRLKLIIDQLDQSKVPALLLIDEMLKGTNSKEKLEGSIMLIEKLVHQECVSFIATHDLALGALEQRFPNAVVNYSFESRIEKDELVFDYQIKQGIASSTNATYLLRKMKIV